MVKKIKQKEIDKMLPIIIADMLWDGKTRKQITEKQVKRELFHHFIRQMYKENNFAYHEILDEPAQRTGCFIKGYVRDIWAYLGSAYDLVHDQRYIEKMRKILSDK